jgi:anti-sigma factor RsiW
MKCRYARKRLQPLVDGVLTQADAAAIERHLGACAACHAEFERLRLVDGALSGEPAVEPPPGMTEAIVRRARARLGKPPAVLVPRWLEALTFGALGLALVAAAMMVRTAATVAVLRGLAVNLGELFFVVLCIAVALFGSLYYGSQTSAG